MRVLRVRGDFDRGGWKVSNKTVAASMVGNGRTGGQSGKLVASAGFEAVLSGSPSLIDGPAGTSSYRN